MISAFGVVHKGLPSAIKHARPGTLHPLSAGAARLQANKLGKEGGRLKAIQRAKRSGKQQPGGWTNAMLTSARRQNQGHTARMVSRERIAEFDAGRKKSQWLP